METIKGTYTQYVFNTENEARKFAATLKVNWEYYSCSKGHIIYLTK